MMYQYYITNHKTHFYGKMILLQKAGNEKMTKYDIKQK